ncbi:hypothetical protein TSAR_013074 [Trichomalopsis sarcophagae]|uniref:Uncharacterized protein n=1 Tax=Trichomalopsis sarcophagae TaxID=543379 RepID=A0A232FMR2_9HYME|nr:hypothetical protein TSAR_013074 [Trichomalopsis sarcophagae]
MQKAYEDAVQLETRMEAKIIPDSRPYRGTGRYYNNQDYYNGPQNSDNYRNYGGYRHVNLKIITHITIIEAITIEEENIKIIMAIKVDEDVTIVSTIMGSNNVIIGRFGIAMETGEISKYSIMRLEGTMTHHRIPTGEMTQTGAIITSNTIIRPKEVI